MLLSVLLFCTLAMMFTACESQASDIGSQKETITIVESEHRATSQAGDTMKTEEIQTATETTGTSDISVWYPYWDYATADAELKAIGDELDTICFFAAYYDVNNRPFIPEDTTETYNKLSKNDTLKDRNTYLTFVNDKLLDKGSSLKDTNLLYALIGNDDLANQHVADVIALTKSLGCTGVEIDYEAIKKDYALWQLFNSFVTKLSQAAANEGLALRVVFEPSAPFQNYSWPSNAEYVMMCYNLHGYGTEPGAKANPSWIKELAAKMNTLPGRKNLALATGGFDFAAGGNVAQIGQAEAVGIMSQKNAEAQRDAASGAMWFSYTDESGLTHQVWYADQETLRLWIQAAREGGINRVSIWRLGGNT
jgi:spore germination protein YaaH